MSSYSKFVHKGKEWYHTLESKGYIDSDYGLALLFLCVAVFMYFESKQFQSSAKLFPQFTAVGVFLGSVLLLVRRWLPAPLASIVDENVELFAEASEDVDAEIADSPTTSPERPTTRSIPDFYFMIGSFVSYIGLGYLFGLLWASPLYVFAYTVWHEKPKVHAAVLALSVFILAYLFMSLLNVNLSIGYVQSKVIEVWL